MYTLDEYILVHIKQSASVFFSFIQLLFALFLEMFVFLLVNEKYIIVSKAHLIILHT